MSENLLPRAAYDFYLYEKNLRWFRIAFATGLFFAVLMWLAFMAAFDAASLIVDEHLGFLPFVFLNTIVWGVAGAFFGLPMTIWTRWYWRRSMRKALDRIYYRDATLAPPPSDDGDYRYRLPVGYHVTPRMNVGGILYLGPSGVMFYPHTRNLPRHREPVWLGPLASIELEILPPAPHRIARMILSTIPPWVRISSATATGDFSFPDPHESVGILQRAIKELRVSSSATPE